MVDDGSLAAVLSDFARTMVADFPVQAILDRLVARIVEVLPVTAAGVALVTPETAAPYVAASNEVGLRLERLQIALGEGPWCTACVSGEAVAVGDLAADDRYPTFGLAAVAAGLAAVFTFPLRYDNGCLGALDLYLDVPGALDREAQSAAQTLADVATAYLRNAQAREGVVRAMEWFRDRSLHDALTGLPNRLLLQERIEHAARRARRTHTAVAVLFADLDGFKRVNDTHGHSVGDDLLIAVAARMSALLRPGDTLARVSGDEFVFLCEDLAHASDVDGLVARIDGAFGAPFVLPGVELAVRASVGVAYAGPGEAVTESLVSAADQAMYAAKRRGGVADRMVDQRIAEQAHATHPAT